MSAVSESMNRRMTLGLLASRYGFDLDPAFATEVTVTSIADDIDSVRPGALFMPSMQVDEQQLRQVQALGAYGAVVPHALRGKTDGVQIPLIYAEPTEQQLGKLGQRDGGQPIRFAGGVRRGWQQYANGGTGCEGSRGFPAHARQSGRRD